MTANKRKWFAPELIVLVRTLPEEGILSACKERLKYDNNWDSFGNCWIPDCSRMCNAMFES